MQLDDQRGDVRTQLRAGRAQRVGSLQPVPALDAPLTLRAIAHLDFEVTNDRFDRRELFLILRSHVAARNRAAAVRTRRRDRCRVRLVDLRRARAATVTPVTRTRSPSGTSAATLRPVLGERGRLPAPGAARRRQLLFQVVVLALQTVDLALQTVLVPLQTVDLTLLPFARALAAPQLCTQPRDLVALVSNPVVGAVTRGRRFLIDHTGVMPYSGKSTIQKVGSLLWLTR
jgi:hypothetical protein